MSRRTPPFLRIRQFSATHRGKMAYARSSLVPTPSGSPPAIGDGQPATSVQLIGPSSVTVDGAGNLYFVDHLLRVRKVSPDGSPAEPERRLPRPAVVQHSEHLDEDKISTITWTSRTPTFE